MRKSVTLSTRAAEACLLLAAALSLAPAALGMDRVRAESNIDAAVAKYGVTGRGVIVALLDRGIDWTNSDFRNAGGTPRIISIFDLPDPTGANAPGNTYARGTIYTPQQIDAALAGGPTLATRAAGGPGKAGGG